MTAAQLDAVGWRNRQGLSDYANQFHYYRLTEDNRILWGGYDAIYYFGGKVNPEPRVPARDLRPVERALLHDLPAARRASSSSHVWGGAIDTCTRYCVFWDTAMQGRVAYAAGYTGLGVCSTRFGAEVLVDLLDGRRTERTALEFVRKRPLPVPARAGPVRWASSSPAGRSTAPTTAHGHRNVWLRILDRLGLGFES